MTTYTEIYSNGVGIKDISATRFYFLAICENLGYTKKRNRDKYNFMQYFQKSHFEYIVKNPLNL